MAERRICVVTGTRAEYGLLKPLMLEIDAAEALQLQVLVTGAHLEERFGATVSVIEEDGIEISARIEMGVSDDSSLNIAKSIGRATIKMAETFAELEPDCIVVLGDRYEILAAAQSALILGVPVVHIHGGELTDGAFDDAIRHAVTKLSHLHFAAAEEYRRRIIQLGERPETVHNVGALCLDSMASLEMLDRDTLARELQFPIADAPFFLVTLHPTTLDETAPGQSAKELLDALDAFPDFKVVITGINADPGNSEIAELIEFYRNSASDRVKFSISLGQHRYYSAMKYASAVVGNSSSGVIEAPALGVPTVNIGTRQSGRLRTASVIDCECERDQIIAALKKSQGAAFRRQSADQEYPFGTAGASKRIVEVLQRADFQSMVIKPFHDIAMVA